MKKVTQSVKEQTENFVGKGPKWLPHSCQAPKSHKIGKPKGTKGGGRKNPAKIHQTHYLYPTTCPGCNASLDEERTYFVYDKVLTELFWERDEVDAYEAYINNIIKPNFLKLGHIKLSR